MTTNLADKSMDSTVSIYIAVTVISVVEIKDNDCNDQRNDTTQSGDTI